MRAETNKLSYIFNGQRILRIPFFQRSYVWGEDEWKRLLSDLVEKQQEFQPGRPHELKFMGALILKQEITATSSFGDVRILVDGQQRLTTLVVLMKVLSLKKGISEKFDRQFKDSSDRIVIEHNLHDLDDFKKLMQLKSLEGDEIVGGRIVELFSFLKNSNELDLLDWDFVLNLLSFVVIDLDHTEDEQEIFDAINSLGVRLTTSELLKNYAFSREQKELYNETWKVEFETEHRAYWNQDFTAGRVSRSLQDVFFHAFLQVKVQEPSLQVSNSHKDRYAKVAGLFKSFRGFIEEYDIDKKELVREIIEYARLFRENVEMDVLKRSVSANSGMQRLSVIIFGLENSTVLPYLMYVLKYAENGEIVEICKYLESYLCRRLICKNESNNYNKLFTRELIGNKILTGGDLQNFINAQRTTDAVNRMPSASEYRKAWMENKLTNKIARGILYLLETGTSSGHVSLNGLNSYSLEHIMPKKWRNHWPAPSAPLSNEDRDEKLLKLGNLTLLTQKLNTSIRDFDWKTKVSGNGKNPGLKQCSNGIEIFNGYIERDDWDESVIDERTLFLESRSLDLWEVNPC